MISKLVRLSAEAYESKEVYRVRNESFLYEDSHDGIYIAFAGSDDVTDWRENLDIDSKNVGCLSVHEGFWDAMLSVWPLLITKLKASDFQNRRVYITGHSRGGALGFCLRLKLAMEGYNQENIFFTGFATPRVVKGDSATMYCQLYNNNVTLCEVEGDPVPHMPREYMGYVTLYNDIHYAKAPWYLKMYGVRAILHRISYYIKKFG